MAGENPAEFDRRPGLFLANEMPENLKVAGLSDAAFRTLIKAWCFCSRVNTDGKIPAAIWDTLGPPKARRELMAEPLMAPGKSPLVVAIEGGVLCHDYLLHNRSRAEREVARRSKGEAGAQGAHTRWHVLRRRSDPDCPYCQEGGSHAP